MLDYGFHERLKEFITRAKMKYKKHNIIDNHYVEYMEQRLYWIYDYKTEFVTMVYANNPTMAVLSITENKDYSLHLNIRTRQIVERNLK